MSKKRHFAVLMPSERIKSKIYIIRNKKVMLDRELAELYGVETGALNQAVKRNLERFPEDFMFQLSKEEAKNWISQIVISNKERMGLRKMPYAFTEQGVAMLSSVLHSKIAIEVNIRIIRTFMELRELITNNELIRQKIEELEKKYQIHDQKFQIVFDAIRELLAPPPVKEKKPIGFSTKYE